MNLSPMAALFLLQLEAAERERLNDWAERIAIAHGRDTVAVADVKAAVRCAGEEFLPVAGEYVKGGE